MCHLVKLGYKECFQDDKYNLSFTLSDTYHIQSYSIVPWEFKWHPPVVMIYPERHRLSATVYPNKYAHGFVVLCFVVVMQSFIMNSHEVFIHIHRGCFAGTGAIVRLPQCQWSKPDGYGKISQCITATKHSKAKTVCIFLGIYCTYTWAGLPWCCLFLHIHGYARTILIIYQCFVKE